MEILLIRHGKPTGATNSKLSASGFANWVRNYNKSKIAPESLPPKDLTTSLRTHFIISSDLTRAVDSAHLCVNRAPNLKSMLFREMDLPRYKLPFTFKAYTWLLISRVFWLAGFSGKVESFKMGKDRAQNSAKLLHDMAKQHGKVAFFGHGMINRYVAKELKKIGWNGSSKDRRYWSVIKLKF